MPIDPYALMYPTEKSMGADIMSVINGINPASEIQQTQAAINAGMISAKDLPAANSYIADMQKRLAAGKTGNTPTASGVDLNTIFNPGYATDEQQAAYQSGQSEAEKNYNAGGGADPLGFIKENIGNVGLIVLGVVVVAIALVATVSTKSFVIKTGAKALGA